MAMAEDVDLIDRFSAFYRRHCQQALGQLAESYPDAKSLVVDWRDLYRYDPDIARDFLDKPGTVREYAEVALEEYDFPVDISLDDVQVRLTNLPDSDRYNVGAYPPDEVQGTIAAVRGQVAQVTQPDLYMREAAYECQRCGTLNRIPQGNESQEPHECQGCERQGPFQINFDQSEMVNHQMVRLQTPPEQVTESGTDTIDYRVIGDAVGHVQPGERVVATGEIHLRSTDSDRPTFDLYGDADWFEHLERDIDDVAIQEHKEEFMSIANSGEAIEEIVASIAPRIFGYEHIKEAIAYQLFGGVRKEFPDGSTLRGSPHILMVGDPGLGKTQLIKYATELAPRSVYTSGQGATRAGLTAAAVKDDFGDGGWTIQAGALVKAHKGVAGIDELDKMTDEDRSGLLEAMESQTITKTAAGKNVTLPAQTTVLAGANPSQGRFNPHQQISEQVDLHPALFSRFDLLFTMEDRVDPEKDEPIAKHMTDTAKVGQQLKRGEDPGAAGQEVTPTIDADVLRAYIAYARQECYPVLTDAAQEELQERYLKIRLAASESDSTVPTTPRTLEAMTRLAEAKARTRIAETITVDDVTRVCDMVEAALRDVGVDPETGEFDTDVIETGVSTSQRQRRDAAVAIIADLEDKHDFGVPVEEVKEVWDARNFPAEKFDHCIEQLMRNGRIYEPQTDELLTT